MNLVTGQTYIGQTTRYKRDYTKDHFGDSTYYGSGVELKKGLRKYGYSNFVRHTIEVVKGTQETLNNRETFWIQELKPEYNKMTKCNGPGCGIPCSDERKKKLVKEIKAKKDR